MGNLLGNKAQRSGSQNCCGIDSSSRRLGCHCSVRVIRQPTDFVRTSPRLRVLIVGNALGSDGPELQLGTLMVPSTLVCGLCETGLELYVTAAHNPELPLCPECNGSLPDVVTVELCRHCGKAIQPLQAVITIPCSRVLSHVRESNQYQDDAVKTC
jgi:hypothetical protein